MVKEGKRLALVTGAARGIGLATASRFLAEGWRVALLDIDAQTLAAAHERLALPGDTMAVECDVAEPDQVTAAVEAVAARFGRTDALVNNAGLRQRNLFPPTGKITTLETKDSDWEKMFGVGVFGTLKVTRKFIQPMLERQSGSVISVISGGAMHTAVGGAYVAQRSTSREMPYQSAKAATLTMMFYLADEVKENNVAVNILIPGNARTTGYDEQNEARRAAGQSGSSNRPGRFSMTPEHIVPITLFLAGQDANTGITGKCFDVPTWNLEHGLGGPEAWRDPDANRA